MINFHIMALVRQFFSAALYLARSAIALSCAKKFVQDGARSYSGEST